MVGAPGRTLEDAEAILSILWAELSGTEDRVILIWKLLSCQGRKVVAMGTEGKKKGQT